VPSRSRARAFASAARQRLALLGVPRSTGQAQSGLEDRFRERARRLEAPRVLELGTARAIPERSTMHRDLVPHAAEFLGTDLVPGADVDIVADVHRLSEVAGEEAFDVILSFSTFEHLKYPHRAAHEVLKTLTVGGLVFVQTHQAFPLHAYPADYFRFTPAGVRSLFPRIEWEALRLCHAEIEDENAEKTPTKKFGHDDIVTPWFPRTEVMGFGVRR